MLLRAQWPLGTIAQFFHFVAEEKNKKNKKKKDDKKTKVFYDWATTGIPVIITCLTGNMTILSRSNYRVGLNVNMNIADLISFYLILRKAVTPILR